MEVLRIFSILKVLPNSIFIMYYLIGDLMENKKQEHTKDKKDKQD